jgi:hypothetical protein
MIPMSLTSVLLDGDVARYFRIVVKEWHEKIPESKAVQLSCSIKDYLPGCLQNKNTAVITTITFD